LPLFDCILQFIITNYAQVQNYLLYCSYCIKKFLIDFLNIMVR